MKTIENRQTEMPWKEKENGAIKKASYFDLVQYCLNQPPPGGFTVEEMRRRLPVAEKLPPEAESAEIEDADLSKLKECVGGARWVAMDPVVLDFTDYICSL